MKMESCLYVLNVPMSGIQTKLQKKKDLKVKGAPKDIKQGTRVKNIRLVEGDHNIDCKIDGFGAMKLKSEFVKKI